MKFYRENNKTVDYWNKTKANKLTCIYCNSTDTSFYKNGLCHNNENAAYLYYNRYKEFRLNGKYYGNSNEFTKLSWRRFVKMQAFL